MATTIDHLSVDHNVRVIREFVDARGVHHDAGEEGLIVGIALDMRASEISIQWQRDGQRESMYFSITGRAGPGNGRMREYFEVEAYVDPGREGMRFIPFYGYVPLEPPAPPSVSGRLITTDEQFDDAIERVWALAGRGRFDEANEQLNAIVSASDRRGDNTDRAAARICGLAKAHAFDADPTVYEWLRERGISLWYAWGSGATSGGEGSYRATEIRAAEKAFVDIDRARVMITPGTPERD